MLGKEKCRILKEIRQRIAEENDIPYVTRECHHQGACRGTCPRCESELRYLERQLALRASLGWRVSVAALCAGMAMTASGCTAADVIPLPHRGTELSGAVPYEQPTPTPEPEIYVEMGEVAWPEETDPADVPPPAETEPVEGEIELMGDVAWEPEAEENDG